MMDKNFKKEKKGFVVLFSVVIASIIFLIAIGVSNISLQEINFGTSAKETNEAFLAADTGAECALNNDKSTSNVFIQSGGLASINCNEKSILLTDNSSIWSFRIDNLGTDGNGCAEVTVTKDFFASPVTTQIISKGYNDCTATTKVERQLELNYPPQ